ncbi:uncharacterized protein LOC106639596 [Copidosoma floridanum]|uniref:uncharacterized protein LOC106639596 n=1 Tax=Copidosoma floridanum TaxID=29053 RepID=UPI000C6F9849|nr:uncharacterized protein LOC106639596 [Copidosoma floridanum]
MSARSRVSVALAIFALCFGLAAAQAPVTILLVLEEPDAGILSSINGIMSEAESTFGANLIKVDVQYVLVDREYVDGNFEKELNQTLYYLIGNSIIRLVVIDYLSPQTVERIGNMRPLPSYYIIYAKTKQMEELFKTALEGGLVKRDGVWHLVFMDYDHKEFSYFKNNVPLNVTISALAMKESVCCHLMYSDNPRCECPADFQIFDHYFRRLVHLVVEILSELQSANLLQEPQTGQCNTKNATGASTNGTLLEFDKKLMAKIANNDTFEYVKKRNLIAYKAEADLKVLSNGKLETNGTWDREHGIEALPNRTIQAARRYFRIGTTESIPWTIKKLDPETGEPLRKSDGSYQLDGYCIDLIDKLASMMDFDYDIVVPEDGDFGQKIDGVWTGLVGDLAKGQTDIAVAALTMTSEREEVIDFVAPYFEQSGILVVMRKPVRRASLFKFMTVLKIEVWLSIVGALTLTGIMIWLLDKYSPYSARNNKQMYPYPCREFTLKESFWFALTSFTPQGGGEAPKALSSRTLVAAYWLFVVLMLATFTANLAAFLTVERMQSPVQSLEQLARQSRINYTVLKNSTVHQYFKNMKSAEERLYQVWKELTLNSTSDQVEYRVWDYPIKEQYGHILQAITAAGPVKTVEEGFRKKGGVFIATLVGLLLAMLTLAGEVFYYRRRNAKLEPQEHMRSREKFKGSITESDQMMIQKLASRLQLKPAPTFAFDGKSLGSKQPKISHISVYPRDPFPFKD